MKKTFISVLLISVCINYSCVKEPVPCINSFTQEVEVFKQVDFGAGCTEHGYEYQWEFEELALLGIPNKQYKEEQYVQHTWFYPGTFNIELTVYSKKRKYNRSITETIVVKDVCYICTDTSYYGSNFNFCSSEYLSQYNV